ncbi:MAG: hypothetical protein IPN79_03025 [Saprospiraceae bacterium]|nr:hypothetical protein [Saprospiraceae bacterium]
MRISFPLFATFLSFMFLTACEPKECCVNFPDEECPENIACTEVFVTVSVPFAFKNIQKEQIGYSTTKLFITGETILKHTYSNDQIDDESFAFLVNDNHLDQIRKMGTDIQYTLFDTSGKQILVETFTVAHDCCHVFKKSGKDILSI